MPADPKRVELPGSNRIPFRNAQAVRPCNADERFEVTVMVKSRNPLSQDALLAPWNAEIKAADKREPLSHSEFVSQHGADPNDLKKIEAFHRSTV